MIDHLSATQVNMWLRCPRQYSFRYWEDIKIPPSGALIQGSCYHKALETNFSQKIESTIDLPIEAVLDAFSDSWTQRLREEDIDWEDKTPGALKDQAAGLVAVYQEHIAPHFQPTLVEQRIERNINGVPFVGIIDLVAGGCIIDHKTASQSWSQDKVDTDIQATAYSYLMQEISDIEFHVAVKTKTPKIQRLYTHRGVGDVLWWAHLVTAVIQQIELGIAPPNPNGWHCSPKMCGYWTMCHKMI